MGLILLHLLLPQAPLFDHLTNDSSKYSKPTPAVLTSNSLPLLGTDSQSQMMLLLAHSLSKLSTALGEKGLDSKTE